MKSRSLFLLLGVLFLVSSSVGLQNFEYSRTNNFSMDLTGGESLVQEVNFTNEANQGLPLKLRVSVDSNKTSFETGRFLGREFKVSAVLNSSDRISSFKFKPFLQQGALVYRAGSLERVISPGSRNNLRIVLESNTAIHPDEYNISYSLESISGFTSGSKTLELEEGSETVSVGGDSVTLRSSEDVNVTVESYEQTTIPPPYENFEFLGGVSVNRTSETGLSGFVRIPYDEDIIEDEDSVRVYRYSGSGSGWETEGITVVERDTEEDFVRARVDRFSMYAAFAPEETSDHIEIPPKPPEDDEEQQDEDSEEDSDGDDSGREETPPGLDEGQGPDDSAVDNSAPESPVGQFFSSPTGILTGLFAIILILVIYLEQKGKIDLKGYASTLRVRLGRGSAEES